MHGIDNTTTATDPEVGRRLRVHLPDGDVIDGVLVRADRHTLRLRDTGRGPLVVVYRLAALGVQAA